MILNEMIKLAYLILFPQQRKLVIVNGRFHHLHFQVVDAEIEVPKPEHDTVTRRVCHHQYTLNRTEFTQELFKR